MPWLFRCSLQGLFQQHGALSSCGFAANHLNKFSLPCSLQRSRLLFVYSINNHEFPLFTRQLESSLSSMEVTRSGTHIVTLHRRSHLPTVYDLFSCVLISLSLSLSPSTSLMRKARVILHSLVYVGARAPLLQRKECLQVSSVDSCMVSPPCSF